MPAEWWAMEAMGGIRLAGRTIIRGCNEVQMGAVKAWSTDPPGDNAAKRKSGDRRQYWQQVIVP